MLLTDLLNAHPYPATALLELYRARWSLERVCHQLTAVCQLHPLMGTTPQGTVLQFAFWLLLYNVGQGVRAYVATAQARPVQTLSPELLFDDGHRQLVALTERVPPVQSEPRFAPLPSVKCLREPLTTLLATVGTPRGLKAPPKKPKAPVARHAIRGNQTSVYRLVTAYRQQKGIPSP